MNYTLFFLLTLFYCLMCIGRKGKEIFLHFSIKATITLLKLNTKFRLKTIFTRFLLWALKSIHYAEELVSMNLLFSAGGVCIGMPFSSERVTTLYLTYQRQLLLLVALELSLTVNGVPLCLSHYTLSCPIPLSKSLFIGTNICING